MKIRTRLLALQIPVVIAAMVMLSACFKVDRNYDLDKYDKGEPMIGGEDSVIKGPLVKETRLLLVDMIDFEEIKAANPEISAVDWDQLEGTPIEIPAQFTVNELPLDETIDESIIKMLTGDGRTYLYVRAESSLTFDAEIRLDFLTPGSQLDPLFDPIRIEGEGGEISENTPGSKIEITEQTLRTISEEATGLDLVIISDVAPGEKVTFRKDMWIQIAVKLEKHGGIPLESLFDDNDEE